MIWLAQEALLALLALDALALLALWEALVALLQEALGVYVSTSRSHVKDTF